MNISNVSAGDVVEVEIRGWTFLARVDQILKKSDEFDLKITPEKKNVTHYHCNAGDVTAHFKRMGRPRASTPDPKPEVKRVPKAASTKPVPKKTTKPASKKTNPFIAKAKAKA